MRDDLLDDSDVLEDMSSEVRHRQAVYESAKRHMWPFQLRPFARLCSLMRHQEEGTPAQDPHRQALLPKAIQCLRCSQRQAPACTETRPCSQHIQLCRASSEGGTALSSIPKAGDTLLHAEHCSQP